MSGAEWLLVGVAFLVVRLVFKRRSRKDLERHAEFRRQGQRDLREKWAREEAEWAAELRRREQEHRTDYKRVLAEGKRRAARGMKRR